MEFAQTICDPVTARKSLLAYAWGGGAESALRVKPPRWDKPPGFQSREQKESWNSSDAERCRNRRGTKPDDPVGDLLSDAAEKNASRKKSPCVAPPRADETRCFFGDPPDLRTSPRSLQGCGPIDVLPPSADAGDRHSMRLLAEGKLATLSRVFPEESRRH